MNCKHCGKVVEPDSPDTSYKGETDRYGHEFCWGAFCLECAHEPYPLYDLDSESDLVRAYKESQKDAMS